MYYYTPETERFEENKVTREELLELTGYKWNPFIKGHFRGTAGMDFETYFAKDYLNLRPMVIGNVAKLLAELFMTDKVEVVAVPAVGSCILGNRVAEWLMRFKNPGDDEVLSVYADKVTKGFEQSFEFKRGFGSVLKGANVLVVEDVINTRQSVNSVIRAVRSVGGYVVGVGAICTHSKITAKDLNVPYFESLVCLDEPTYYPSRCPLCKNGIPLSKEFGHG